MKSNKQIENCIKNHYSKSNAGAITIIEKKVLHTSEQIRKTYRLDYKLIVNKDTDAICVVAALEKVGLNHILMNRTK